MSIAVSKINGGFFGSFLYYSQGSVFRFSGTQALEFINLTYKAPGCFCVRPAVRDCWFDCKWWYSHLCLGSRGPKLAVLSVWKRRDGVPSLISIIVTATLHEHVWLCVCGRVHTAQVMQQFDAAGWLHLCRGKHVSEFDMCANWGENGGKNKTNQKIHLHLSWFVNHALAIMGHIQVVHKTPLRSTGYTIHTCLFCCLTILNKWPSHLGGKKLHPTVKTCEPHQLFDRK